jgi:hypothetical protein
VHPYLAAWRHASTRLDAELHVADGDLNASAELQLSYGGVEIVARGHFAGGFSTTRLTASLPATSGVRLRVRERRVRAPLRRGMRAIEIGQGAFADQLRVDGNDERLAELWLSPRVRQAIVDADPHDRYELSISDGVIGAVAPGRFENDTDVLIGVVDAVRAIIDRATEIETSWRELAVAVGGRVVAPPRLDGVPSMAVIRGGADLSIDLFMGPLGGGKGADAAFTRVTCRRRSELTPDPYIVHLSGDAPRVDAGARLRPAAVESLAPEYQVRASVFAPLEQRFEPPAPALFAGARPSLVAATEAAVVIWLAGVVLDPGRLAAALKLCLSLAMEAEERLSGPYR